MGGWRDAVSVGERRRYVKVELDEPPRRTGLVTTGGPPWLSRDASTVDVTENPQLAHRLRHSTWTVSWTASRGQPTSKLKVTKFRCRLISIHHSGKKL